MKALYSQLKKYLPELKAKPEEVGAVFTEIGFMQDGPIEKVSYLDKKDYFLDLEVRQNRADCFGVQGLARELSSYYGIELQRLPITDGLEAKDLEIAEPKDKLEIQVDAKNSVKRLLAVRFRIEKIAKSPRWLTEYLALYEINSINIFVDLTNYVMIETGHPSHAFDAKLSGDKLIWEINPTYKTMTSLDGTKIDLVKEALVVSNGKEPLALAGLVGGRAAEMSEDSKEVILEMAVYDGGLIRRNSRQMKVITEASSRLEKFMDPDSIPEAFLMLIELILNNCKARISSELYDNYLQKEEREVIKVNLDKVQQIAGIEILHKESMDYLGRLGFEIISQEGSIVSVKRPINRLDIEQEEDVFEEIIRLKGFYKIPTDKFSLTVVRDVTPSHLNLIDKLKSMLVHQGWDEVRSWVLVDEEKNNNANFLEQDAIKVENSINDEVPILRQTIAISLIGQLNQYNKNFIPDVNLFEVGKVFGKSKSKFSENYSLGLMRGDKNINKLKITIESLIRSCGIADISYQDATTLPNTAHPKTCFDIIAKIEGKSTILGIIYVTNETLVQPASLAELNINTLDEHSVETEERNSTVEITQKLVTLDANVVLNPGKDIGKHVITVLSNVADLVWKWETVDQYAENGQIKYTLRVTYLGLSDQEAKEKHLELFVQE